MTSTTKNFIVSIRAAASLFSPTVQLAEPQPSLAQGNAIQAGLRNAAFWLTANTYKDYESADFAELSVPARQELGFCVSELRRFINEFPVGDPPPKQIFDAAAPVFLKLVKLLETYYPRK